MLVNDSLADSDPVQFELLISQIDDFVLLLKETDLILQTELKTPSVPSDAADNVIHVNFAPISEFEKLEKKFMPLAEVIATYTRWNEILWEMVHVNVGNYKNKKLVLYLMQLRQIVGTFGNFFENNPE